MNSFLRVAIIFPFYILLSKCTVMNEEKKIVIIGAGASGLCAARHAISHGYKVTVYEQTENIGGTWVYSEQAGSDAYDLPIHTSMYESLETNLPIESMGFPGFNFPNKGKSFVTHKEVYEFLLSYAKQYNLSDKVNFEHYVARVTPTDEGQWDVLVKDLKNNSYKTNIFDFVFVCNGHNSKPSIPDFSGSKNFKGKQIHSHSYRRPDVFEGENVLIIGAGPSGKDILYNLANKAKHVVISTHKALPNDILPSNVFIKPDVKEVKETSVVFVDGSEENFTTILYCTGYKFSFPFLSVDSGTALLNQYYVHPLYKHVINANNPTMGFIGLQMNGYTTLIYDLQVRFCLSFWNKNRSLPTKDEMLEDIKSEIQKQWDRGVKKRMAHFLGENQPLYCRDLAQTAGIDDVPEVYFTMYKDIAHLRNMYPNSYRQYNYKIIDNAKFERFKCCE